MRTLSLHQPWASAIALGLKRIETRHWSTGYRGPLAIHAAKRWDADQREFAAVERSLGRITTRRIPLGAVVAVCRLVDCRPSEEIMAARDQFGVTAVERIYGNYSDGRYGLILDDIRPLDEPIGFIGRQKFFQVPDGLFPAAIRQEFGL